MLFRLNRTNAARRAYQYWDADDIPGLLRFLSRELRKPGADLELRYIRGKALDAGTRPERAIPEWEACLADPELAGFAHFLLGQASKQDVISGPAHAHFQAAIDNGCFFGHAGFAELYHSSAMRMLCDQRDLGVKLADPEVPKRYLDRALTECDLVLATELPVHPRATLLRLRGSILIHQGHEAEGLADIAECERLLASQRNGGR